MTRIEFTQKVVTEYPLEDIREYFDKLMSLYGIIINNNDCSMDDDEEIIINIIDTDSFSVKFSSIKQLEFCLHNIGVTAKIKIRAYNKSIQWKVEHKDNKLFFYIIKE